MYNQYCDLNFNIENYIFLVIDTFFMIFSNLIDENDLNFKLYLLRAYTK